MYGIICVLQFSHDNNSMTYTSAELVSLLRVLVRCHIGDEDGGWRNDWQHQPGNEVFSSYLDRVEQFLIANNIKDDLHS